jgi:hypothetical protein
MRRAALAAAIVVVLAAASAGSGATTPIATYCSPTGDVCFGALRKSGAVYLDLMIAARYFARYRLCVDPPRGAPTCRSFPVRRRGAAYASSILWHRNYPNRGPGRYDVTWRLQQPLGPPRSFRLG